jgi:signal peptide peptidase SppA
MENSTFLNSIWAITPEEFQRFASYDFSKLQDPLLIDKTNRTDSDDEPKSYRERVASFMRQFHEKIEVDESGVGTLRIEGPIMPNPDIFDRYYFNACDSVRIARLIRDAASHDEVKSLVLRINSPGGMVVGTPEVGNAIRDFNATGKISVAFADTLMASAAYWIGSQASVIATTESALVGSIGVIRPHVDATGAYEKFGIKVSIFRGGKHKVAGAMGTAMTEEQTDYIQAGVDECHAQFKATVNHHRTIAAEHMEGQVFYGADGMDKGLVDQIVAGLDGAYSATSGESLGKSMVISVDNPENAMSNPAPAPEASPEKAELDSALLRVSELESENATATEQVATLTAERDSVAVERDSAQAKVTELEASLTEANTKLEMATADFDEKVSAAAELKAIELAGPLAEAKAAEIAARAGTDSAEISGTAERNALDASEFASMSADQKWAHCASITDADQKRAFYVKHLANG